MSFTIKNIALLICSVLPLIAMAQDFSKEYKPIQYTGQVPSFFLESIDKKVERESEKKKEVFSTSKEGDFYYVKNFEVMKKMLMSGKIYFNDPLQLYVNQVVDNLLKNRPDLKSKFRFYVTKYPSVNAACWFDGTIFINVGLLARLKSEAELAFVIGHEMNHYLKNHSLLLYKEKIKKTEITRILKEENLMEILSYSRDHEYEADILGFELMQESPYNPKASINVLQTLSTAELPMYFNDSLDYNLLFNQKYFPLDSALLKKTLAKKGRKIDNSSRSDDDDEEDSERMSTHPNFEKRMLVLNDKVLNDTTNQKRFIQGQLDFDKMVLTSRFEMVENFYQDGDYGQSLFHALMLLKEYPNNIYLNEMVTMTLYWLGYYNSIETLNSVIEESYNTYGNAYTGMVYFINQLDKDNMRKLSYSFAHDRIDKNINSEIISIYFAKSTEEYLGKLVSRDWYKAYLKAYPNGLYKKFAQTKLDESLQ